MKPTSQTYDTSFSSQNVRAGVLKTNRTDGARNASGSLATVAANARQKTLGVHSYHHARRTFESLYFFSMLLFCSVPLPKIAITAVIFTRMHYLMCASGGSGKPSSGSKWHRKYRKNTQHETLFYKIYKTNMPASPHCILATECASRCAKDKKNTWDKKCKFKACTGCGQCLSKSSGGRVQKSVTMSTWLVCRCM